MSEQREPTKSSYDAVLLRLGWRMALALEQHMMEENVHAFGYCLYIVRVVLCVMYDINTRVLLPCEFICSYITHISYKRSIYAFILLSASYEIYVWRPFNEEFLEFALHNFVKTVFRLEYGRHADTFMNIHQPQNQSVTPKNNKTSFHFIVILCISIRYSSLNVNMETN